MRFGTKRMILRVQQEKRGKQRLSRRDKKRRGALPTVFEKGLEGSIREVKLVPKGANQ